MLGDMPGNLGEGVAIHADWPAYPGDRGWELSLLRLGDYPLGTAFTCLSIIDQVALFVAESGVREPDQFSEKHMHIAVWLEDLEQLDERGLVDGVEFDLTLSPQQIHMKRQLGPERWEKFYSGELPLGAMLDGEFVQLPVPEDEEPWEEWERAEMWPPARGVERMALYPGTHVCLTSMAQAEIERIARQTLAIPPSLQDRIVAHLAAGLFDSAIRDLAAALEMRMRVYAKSDDFGMKLIDTYINALLATDDYLPARIKSLRQELRSLFKFLRNEFAHTLVALEPSRGYALVSRLCWHVRDVELQIDTLGI